MSRLVIAAAGPGAERWADSSGSSRIVLDYVVLLLFLHGAYGLMMAWSWCMKRAVVAGLDRANAGERRYLVQSFHRSVGSGKAGLPSRLRLLL